MVSNWACLGQLPVAYPEAALRKATKNAQAIVVLEHNCGMMTRMSGFIPMVAFLSTITVGLAVA